MFVILLVMSVLSGNRLPKVLVIANDHLFGESVCALIKNYESCDVIGSVANDDEAIETIRRQKPDVVLVDTANSTADSGDLIQTISSEIQSVNILLIGHETQEDCFFKGLKTGVKGCVSMRDSASVLVSAITDLYHGKHFLSSSAAKMLVETYRRRNPGTDKDTYYSLTKREKEILRFVARGFGSGAIASRLNISLETVLRHRAKIDLKLDVQNKVKLGQYTVSSHLKEIGLNKDVMEKRKAWGGDISGLNKRMAM